MMAVPNMMLSYLINLGLLGDNGAFGGGLVKFSGEGVTPGRKRADENRGGTVSGNYFFAVQISITSLIFTPDGIVISVGWN
jgi:dolichol kinase